MTRSIMARKKPDDDYFICPHCGAEVKVGATFCRECGASDEYGWNEDFEWYDEEQSAGFSGEDDFDYDEFVENEFPHHAPPWSARRIKRLLLGLVVAIVCVAFLYWFISQRF